VPERVPDRLPSTARPQQQRSRGAEGEDGHQRVLGAATAGVVAVPGHAVGATPVEAETRGHELFSQFRQVMRAQRLARRDQEWIGKRLVLPVEADEARNVDHAVVHLPALCPPRNGVDELGEQLVGARHPAGAHVDPGAGSEGSASDRRSEFAQFDTARRVVEQRSLERVPRVRGSHAVILPRYSNKRSHHFRA
jgi:hypothetical protein